MFTERDRERCRQLFDKYYAGRKFHDALYRDLIGRYVKRGDHLLDAGCGRHLRFCRELAPTARVVGIDLERVFDTDNRNAPFAVCGNVEMLPLQSGYFDLIISRSVVEHLSDPVRTFREFSRVLRPGGHVIIITPNKYDYVSVIAALTPYRFHRFIVSRLFRIPPEDVFPTRYRANTIRALRAAIRAAGMNECELDTINHYPAYLMFSPLLFRLGVFYERLTSIAWLRALRGSILCVFQKPSEGASGDLKRRPLDSSPLGES
jgi:SAM-dependent methyltransferase